MSSSDVRALSSKPTVGPPTGDVHPGLPPVLSALLAAGDEGARDAAWEGFVAAHTALLLHTCHTLARDRDAAMDGYAFILEALREDHHHRLRAYVPDPRTRFTTWLVVVARRLLLDRHRHRYGRPRSESGSLRADHAARRRLEDLIVAELDPESLTVVGGAPDSVIIREERVAALRAALRELDPADRLLLAMRFEDEQPVREIARTLRLPSIFHVYRRLGAVLTSLRQTLQARGVDSADV